MWRSVRDNLHSNHPWLTTTSQKQKLMKWEWWCCLKSHVRSRYDTRLPAEVFCSSKALTKPKETDRMLQFLWQSWGQLQYRVLKNYKHSSNITSPRHWDKNRQQNSCEETWGLLEAWFRPQTGPGRFSNIPYSGGGKLSSMLTWMNKKKGGITYCVP